MMIETYKRYDGKALGVNKVSKGSGENEEKIGDIQNHQNPTTKMPILLSQTLLGTD
jgi:hypothetical protein